MGRRTCGQRSDTGRDDSSGHLCARCYIVVALSGQVVPLRASSECRKETLAVPARSVLQADCHVGQLGFRFGIR
jgi:hypothetical protein